MKEAKLVVPHKQFWAVRRSTDKKLLSLHHTRVAAATAAGRFGGVGFESLRKIKTPDPGHTKHREEQPLVLVVDDDQAILELIGEAFTGLPIAIYTASTIGEARSLIQGRLFDLAVLDVYLPDGIGTDLSRSIRSTSPATPIIIMTGGTYEEDVRESLDVDADAYLMKPFDISKLVPLVAELLN